jgi:hypothetical protein
MGGPCDRTISAMTDEYEFMSYVRREAWPDDSWRS